MLEPVMNFSILFSLLILNQVKTGETPLDISNRNIAQEIYQNCIQHCSPSGFWATHNEKEEYCIDKCVDVHHYFKRYNMIESVKLSKVYCLLDDNDKILHFKSIIEKVAKRFQHFCYVTKLDVIPNPNYNYFVKLNYSTPLYFCYNDHDSIKSYHREAFDEFIEQLSRTKNSGEFFSAFSDFILSSLVYQISLSEDPNFEISNELLSIIGFF